MANYDWKNYSSSIKITKPDLENCDGTHHPIKISYRPYRRGKYRCRQCGARDSILPVIEKKLNQMRQQILT